jgi:hypothetical protein
MTAVAESGIELIPGYRLLARLGHGGFGEVWKAEAPGGLYKAIKIVHGSIHGLEEVDAPARQELKALERVKTVRHPFILSLERFDIVGGQLVIVTELADKNLAERLQEFQAQGLAGVPYDELMRYMEETAEALDLMNDVYQLQHLDIKPQNLFLLHNHVKVADFGLVKVLEGKRAQMTSGITIGYAAPETFEGLVSPFCDQYSLAIVYQELLTGRLPFTASNPRQLMMQHVQAAPNLEPLPASDRAVIGRALAKNAEDRYPSCGALVRALRAARSEPAPAATAFPLSPKAVGPEATPVPPTSAVSIEPEGKEASTVYMGPGRRPAVQEAAAARAAEPAAIRSPERPAVPEPPEITGDGFMGPARRPPVQEAAAVRAAEPAAVRPPERPAVPEPPEITGDGFLFPALVIGLGGTGCAVLRCLRKIMCKRWGADGLPHVRLLLLDADPDDLLKATQGDADTTLRRGETLLARLQRPSQYLKPGRDLQTLEKWLDPELLRRLPRDQTTPQGCRALGRLAFSGNMSAILSRLRTELTFCTHAKTLEAAGKQTGLGLRTNHPRVYLVASVGGGTGGGMLLDVAYAARHHLQEMGYRHPEVRGLLLLPAVERAGDKARATANTFATLTEVNYFSAPGRVFEATNPDQGTMLTDPGAPFSRCMVLPVPRGEEATALQEAATMTAEFLVRELATPLAKVADAERQRRASSEKSASGFSGRARAVSVCQVSPSGPVYQTFGAYWFAVPRGLLLRRVARCLCHRLVLRWRAEHAERHGHKVQAWIAKQFALNQLTSNDLASALTEQAETILERPPEQEVEAVLAPWRHSPPQVHEAAEAMAALKALVGSPKTNGALAQTQLGELLVQAVAALENRLEERLPELAMRALAEPHFRLLGLEDMVQARLGDTLTKLSRTHHVQFGQTAQQAAELCPKMASLLQELQRGSFWGRRKKKRTAAELSELLRAYGKLRWQAMIQHGLSALYQDLQINLQKYCRKVECCRRRITQFVVGLEESGTGNANVDLGLGQYLLPAGCRSLESASDQILAGLGEQELEEINGRVQALIGRALEAHVHVCTAPADFLKELEEEVLREVTTFAEGPLGRAHAAEMYVAQRGKDDSAVEELAGAFEAAVPELGSSHVAPEDELNILAVPPGPEGEYFRSLVQRALPDRALVPASSTDDIVFYREVLRLPPSALPQMGEPAAKVYSQFLTPGTFSPHSRTDITDWQK